MTVHSKMLSSTLLRLLSVSLTKKAIEVLSPMALNTQLTYVLSFCPLKDNLMFNKPDLFNAGS